ncbi:hypothetical protein GCM10022239_25580 [Leifsonia bigeumensis]|uniref:Integral membrane protein n=1 Tax=Leifsonella bigeumensis TaxID=433643 RepID=A0ABP7FV19_9MICO
MELLFVVLGAALVGLGLRYLLPGRDTYGSAVLPAVSAAVAAAVWAGLTWIGWTFDGGWIWWASLVAGGVLAIATALILAPRRRHRDVALFDRLSRP